MKEVKEGGRVWEAQGDKDGQGVSDGGASPAQHLVYVNGVESPRQGAWGRISKAVPIEALQVRPAAPPLSLPQEKMAATPAAHSLQLSPSCAHTQKTPRYDLH